MDVLNVVCHKKIRKIVGDKNIIQPQVDLHDPVGRPY